MTDPDLENNDHVFYNGWIFPNELPRAEDAHFIGLDSEYLYVRLSSVLIMLICGGLVLVTFVLLSTITWFATFFILIGFLVLMGLWALFITLEFKHRGYVIRNHDVAYRSGYIFRRKQYLPFRRVQHCKITEGLIERLFNFSTVIVSAAGDDIVIHGLRPDDALALQQFVNEKVDELTKEMNYGGN